MRTSKRQFLKSTIPVIAGGALAGCSSDDSGDDENPNTETESTTEENNPTPDTSSPTPDDTSSTPEEPDEVASVGELQIDEASVVQGAALAFTFTLSNTTDTVQEVPLTVTLAETTENRTEAISGGDSETVEYTLSTENISTGTHDLTVQHESSSTSGEVTVRGVDISDIEAPERSLQGIEITPSFRVTNPTSETQELDATATFGSQESQINEALLADETRRVDATFSTDDLSTGTYTFSVQYSGATISKDIDIEEVDEEGIHGLLETAVDTELGAWRLQAYARRQDSFYTSRARFGGDTRQFQIGHPAEFDSDEQIEPPYDVDLVFQKSGSGGPVFNSVPYGYALAVQTPVESDVAVIGAYELPEAYRVEVQVLDGSGNPVKNSEHVQIRLPNGSGFINFETNESGYLKHLRRDETGVELAGDVTLEYLIDDDFQKRTTRDITVTEQQEFTLTVEEL